MAKKLDVYELRDELLKVAEKKRKTARHLERRPEKEAERPHRQIRHREKALGEEAGKSSKKSSGS